MLAQGILSPHFQRTERAASEDDQSAEGKDERSDGEGVWRSEEAGIKEIDVNKDDGERREGEGAEGDEEEGGRAKMALHKETWMMYRAANGSWQLPLKHTVTKTWLWAAPASFLPSDPVCPSPPSTRGSLISRIEE